MRYLTLLITVVLAASMPVSAQAEEDWERAANERIEQHRKGDFVVKVVDADGNAVPEAAVKVEMTRHAFPFGTALAAQQLVGTPEEAARPSASKPTTAEDIATYRERASELFNRGVLENHHKWRWQSHPNGREVADAATAWMLDQGMTIHAHALIWATLKYGVPMPKDVAEVLQGEAMQDATAEEKAEFLRRRSLEHITDTASHYRGKVVEWDVINENTSEHELSKLINPDVPKERAPIQVEWFKAAHAADPEARLFVNDFHILVGDFAKHKDAYEAQIEYLLEQDVPLGGIGMQCHYHGGHLRRTPEQLMETLGRFARFGLPIQITEYDAFGRGWGETREEKEAAQAEFMRQFYIVTFSHPAVNGITMWGFWDGRHWANNAPLFRRDWSKKPAFDVYHGLVFDQWWTRDSGTTNSDGTHTFRGFYGTYDVSAEVNGQQADAVAEFTEDGAAVTLQLPR